MLSKVDLDEFGSLQREGIRVLDVLRKVLSSFEIDQLTDRRSNLTLGPAATPVYGKFAAGVTGTSAQRTQRLSQRNLGVLT